MSSESSDSWGGGRGGLKILTFAVCHAVAEEAEACEAGRPQGDFGRRAGMVGGRRTGGLVGSRFASTDGPLICRGEVGLEVG